MAAVIGDFVSDPSRFHTMIANPSSSTLQQQPQQAHDSSSPYRSSSSSSSSSRPRPANTSPSSTKHSHLRPGAAPGQPDYHKSATAASAWSPAEGETHASGGGASRFPSPPSSSPAVATDDSNAVSMASQTARDHVSLGHHQPQSIPQNPASSSAAAATAAAATSTIPNNATDSFNSNSAALPRQQQQQPSPPSDDFHASAPSGPVEPSTYPVVDAQQPAAAPPPSPPQQTVIHIRDLAHVQSLARDNMRAGHGTGPLNDPPLQQMKYEISAMPIGDIIEMVAALLTKITTTNDLQHDAMQRNVAHQQQASQSSESAGSSQMSPLSHSVLAFHGKNVPAITILSYLSRIHKYCPTTYEVFLSLLVYFDRMTERVNELVTRSEQARRQSATSTPQRQSSQPAQTAPQPQRDTPMRDDGDSDNSDSDSDLADDDDDDDEMEDSPVGSTRHGPSRIVTGAPDSPALPGSATYFVVDSFNIHRLIIAGVTCASKFFSDVFYTNSRYAKVGGLPLAELNHLELQFLVLNEFRLFVPVEDLEAYATMLVEFYAREVVGKKPAGSRE